MLFSRVSSFEYCWIKSVLYSYRNGPAVSRLRGSPLSGLPSRSVALLNSEVEYNQFPPQFVISVLSNLIEKITSLLFLLSASQID